MSICQAKELVDERGSHRGVLKAPTGLLSQPGPPFVRKPCPCGSHHFKRLLVAGLADLADNFKHSFSNCLYPAADRIFLNSS